MSTTFNFRLIFHLSSGGPRQHMEYVHHGCVWVVHGSTTAAHGVCPPWVCLSGPRRHHGSTWSMPTMGVSEWSTAAPRQHMEYAYHGCLKPVPHCANYRTPLSVRRPKLNLKILLNNLFHKLSHRLVNKFRLCRRITKRCNSVRK